MITIMQTGEVGFIQVSEIKDNCWVNVYSPSTEELARLSTDLDIPMDFLTDTLDVDERSRIETENGLILLIFRAPRYDRDKSDLPFTTVPIGIAINRESHIITTICSSDLCEILELAKGKGKTISIENINHFIIQLLQRSAFFYLKYLKEINKKSNEVETELQKATRNEELIKLLNIEKSLVFFTTSLKSNEFMIERLQKIRPFELSDDDRDFLEDVIIDNKQAIEMANIYSNILSGMMDAFASVISNNLNIVMKFLTSITIILMIPTLIASIYGMNIELPFQHSSHAFFITIGFSFALSSLGVMIFLKNRWF